ncbi:MAG: methyl-accepting chemotaxis protein [Anaeromyxobacter sp.]
MSTSSDEPTSIAEITWHELEQANRDLAQVRSIVADAVKQLGSGFSSVARESKLQQELLIGLLSQVEGSGRSRVNVVNFVSNSEELVGRVASGLDGASQRTIELVHQLSTIDTAFKKLNTLSGSVLDVSEHIRVLALNANLEATRAGYAGRGFAVVASAVRELSTNFRSLTEQIRATVEEARRSLSETIMSARTAVETDRTTVVQTREEMRRLQEETSRLREEMGESLRAAQQMGEAVHQGVNRCLRGLQFDDLVGQVAEAAGKRMRACSRLFEGSELCSGGSLEAGAVGVGVVAELDTLRHRSVQQTTLDAGEVEFF